MYLRNLTFLLLMACLPRLSEAQSSPQMVKDTFPNLQPNGLTPFNDQLLFFTFLENNWRLWISDGTDAGTHPVTTEDIYFSGSSQDIFVLNDVAYLRGNDGQHGWELWRTDGTSAGTYLVKDIQPGSGDGLGFGPYVEYGGKLYFPAQTGDAGLELWVSDGTEAGTQMVKDLATGTNESSFPEQFLVFDNTLYFIAQGEHPGLGATLQQIYRSDGTQAGTYPINANQLVDAYSDTRQIAAFAGNIYFLASEEIGGESGLYSLDPATEGITIIKNDIDFDMVEPLLPLENYLLFAGSDVLTGTELWRTDGTTAGTELVTEIVPGNASGVFTLLGSDGQRAYLRTFEEEIYVSDGTAGGTEKIFGENGAEYVFPNHLIAGSSTQHLFFTSDHPTETYAIWWSDGTPGGTTTLADIDGTTAASSAPGPYALVNQTLFFRGDNASNGPELWKIDLDASLLRSSEKPVLSFFPNPASHQLFLNRIRDGTFHIYTMQGRLIRSGRADFNIDVSRLPPGSYMVQLESEGKLYRGHFIKQ